MVVRRMPSYSLAFVVAAASVTMHVWFVLRKGLNTLDEFEMPNKKSICFHVEGI